MKPSLLVASVMLFFVTNAVADYPPNALKSCSTFASGVYFKDCLRIIENQTFETAPLSACEGHRYPDDFLICLTNIASGTFQASALSVCQQHSTAHYFNDCLSIIRDRTYSADELALCAEEPYPDTLNECLELFL